MNNLSPVPNRLAFSLLELLVVVALMVVLLILGVPAIRSVLTGQEITRGGQLVHDQMALARQLSISRNAPVELRLYYGQLRGAPEGQEATVAVQLFEIDEQGDAVAVTPVRFLPETVCIPESEPLSNICATLPRIAKTADDPSISRLDGDYSYRTITFRSDGSCDLTEHNFAGNLPFLTVVRRLDLGNDAPSNFFILQIQPETARLKVIRP